MEKGPLRVAPVSNDPAVLWSALAPLLAGQPRVRISRDGGRSYPQRFERDLTDQLPAYPSAIRIFGKDGTCRALFLDFDSSVDGRDRVDADVRLVTTWLHRHGARWIEDFSPSGGRHVYVPLAERVPFHEARDLVEALGTRYRSLDRTPHQNIGHGCMRPPGSPHKKGGNQLLAMSLSLAYDIAKRPNSARVWQALRTDLSEEMAAVRALRLEQSYQPTTTLAEVPETDPVRGMSRTMLAIAVHGIYDASRYASPSEARQAVLVAAAAAGHSLTDVERRIKQGTWPGLAQFYARYPARHRFRTMTREWNKAAAHLKRKQSEKPGKTNVRKSHTSQHTSQAGLLQGSNLRGSSAEHQFIRTWCNALHMTEGRYRHSRQGLARRMILRALGEAAHKTGSRFIEFGVRSLALASGVDPSTVSAHLRALRGETEALIALVEGGRGTHGDLYMLQIPAALEDAASTRSWRKGKIHALRPVFRELGFPAAFLYEALEHSPAPLSTADLVRLTGLSRTAAHEALQVLAAWNLVARSGSAGGWLIVPGTSLAVLAEHFGILEAFAAQIRRYRAERAQWRAWLAGHTLSVQMLLSPGEDYPWEMFEGPPDDVTLADLALGYRT